MEDFINETIDIAQLPKFEEIEFSVLHPNYWKVTLISLTVFFLVMGLALGLVLYFNEELSPFIFQLSIVFAVVLLLVLFFFEDKFQEKGICI